ncbi:retrovirus-like pol polyprotein [Trichonephila clavipes]|nr:retrovirus-like pol polyprotein [Trichonephila clavipes]
MGKTILSKLNLGKAYYQLPLEEELIKKTTISISFGSFEYLWMSFGYSKTTQSFQRFIDNVLRGLNCYAYQNDILMATSSISKAWKKSSNALTSLKDLRPDVTKWTQACLGSQQSKVQRSAKNNLGTFSLPSVKFSHLNCDIVDPLPPSNGSQFLLTTIGRFFRRPGVFFGPDQKAETEAKGLFDSWIFCFGVPKFITMDQSRKFDGHLLKFSHSFWAFTKPEQRPTTLNPTE